MRMPTATAILLCLAVATAGTAQTTGQEKGRTGEQRGGHGAMAAGSGQGAMMDEDFIEGRLAFLKAELALRPDQEKTFDSFAKALRANAETMRDQRRRMTGGDRPDTLPERLDAMEAMMAARLSAIRQMKGPAGELYAALDDTQKAKADRIMMMGMGGGMMGGGMMGGGHMMRHGMMGHGMMGQGMMGGMQDGGSGTQQGDGGN